MPKVTPAQMVALRQLDVMVGRVAGELQKATGCTEDEAFKFLRDIQKDGAKLDVPTLAYIVLAAMGRDTNEEAAKSLEEVGTRLKELINAV